MIIEKTYPRLHEQLHVHKALACGITTVMNNFHRGKIDYPPQTGDPQRKIKVLEVKEITRIESGNLLDGGAAAEHETAADDWDTLAWHRVT